MTARTPDLAELRSLRATWLPRLPAPAVLECAATDAAGDVRRFWVTTSRPHYEAASRARYPVLDGHLWTCLADAADREAAGLALSQWLLPGLPLGYPPAFTFTGNLYALLGMTDRRDRSVADLAAACEATVGSVLDHFGAVLLGTDPPVEACRHTDARLF